MSTKQQSNFPKMLSLRGLAVLVILLNSLACFGSSNSPAPAQVGDFVVVATNLVPGSVWPINRPIQIELNRPIDPSSLGFSSVQMSGVSSGVTGRPVTGSFSLPSYGEGRIVEFQPYCPTENDFSDAGLLPGGHQYTLSLPTATSWSASVLRDLDGRLLSAGIERQFFTPNPPSEPVFYDQNPNPPTVLSINWPIGLNLFTNPDLPIVINFDQAIGIEQSNLSAERVQIFYSDQTISSGQQITFTEQLPGTLYLIKNCSVTGAELGYQVHGILPPDRQLLLKIDNRFEDIGGQQFGLDWQSTPHNLPSLTSYYGDALLGWLESQAAVDEINEQFVDSSLLDPNADLPFPPAKVEFGVLSASFDYAGQFVSEDTDFYWDGQMEVSTDGRYSLYDSNNRAFLMDNGTIYVDDFTITEGSFIRFRGSNPLIIYAQGDVTIDGDLNASGNPSIHPTSLNTPQFPEGPINGECGGGLGGASSQEGLKETLRGQSGDGAFGWIGMGGEGGEGGFQQEQGVGGLGAVLGHVIVGGGGGGTFAMTPNYSIWHKPWDFDQKPAGADNVGPDHIPDKNPYWPDGVWRDPATVSNLDLPIFGGESGNRGSSLDAISELDPYSPPQTAHGIYGMEDQSPDFVDPPDIDGSWDPPWNTPDKPFDDGHPTNGPDPGRAGPTIFDGDTNTQNDFWGRRLNNDGTVTVGELMAPWAGAGGGGSGDSQLIPRPVDQATGALLPLVDSFPVRPFPPSTGIYRKGAPGGGGGGQMMIMAIGRITLGDSAKVRVNGGIGRGGEGTIGTTGQISGSGAGSGGHLIIHSATGLDLSAIDIGTAANAGELPLLNSRSILQAFGGRRGWAAGLLADVWGTTQPDGNGDLMIGRGGAGGNGIVQIHLPDPGNDIDWPLGAATAIDAYLHDFDPANPIDMNRLEEILDKLASPKPYALLPFFAANSQAQSKWIDTGAARLREPTGSVGPWPKYSLGLNSFRGIDSNGDVLVDNESVIPLGTVAEGIYGSANFSVANVTIPNASQVFSQALHFLRTSNLLLGFDILPDSSNQLSTYEIVSADYDATSDLLTLATELNDGSPLSALVADEPWSIQAKYFRIDTQGIKGHLPNSSGIRFEFQGTSDPADPSATIPSPGDWTATLTNLQGLRFVRWRATFDIDAGDEGVTLGSPLPGVDYIKVPFTW